MRAARTLSLLLGVAVISGCTTTYITSAEKQVIDTGEVMELLMDPIHEDLKDFIENPPDKRADWRGLYVAAYTLAETNNLLYSRTDHGYMLQKDWRERVTEARGLTVKLADSIKEQAEYDTIKANYIAVVENCNACHRHYEPVERDAPTVYPPASWGIDPPGGDSGAISFQ